MPAFGTSGPVKAVSPTIDANGYNDSAMKPQQDRRTINDRRRTRTVRNVVFPAAGLGTRFLSHHQGPTQIDAAAGR